MKQHITIEQLNDLIYSDFEAFKELFRTLYSDVGKNEDVWQDGKDIHCDTLYVSKGVVTHHLNIGKMIEILDSICYFNIYKDFETEKETDIYVVSSFNDFCDYELCDALWEAVKYIITMNN